MNDKLYKDMRNLAQNKGILYLLEMVRDVADEVGFDVTGEMLDNYVEMQRAAQKSTTAKWTPPTPAQRAERYLEEVLDSDGIIAVAKVMRAAIDNGSYSDSSAILTEWIDDMEADMDDETTDTFWYACYGYTTDEAHDAQDARLMEPYVIHYANDQGYNDAAKQDPKVSDAWCPPFDTEAEALEAAQTYARSHGWPG